MSFLSYKGSSCTWLTTGLIAGALLMGTGLVADGRQQAKSARARGNMIHSNKWVVSPEDYFPIGTWIVGTSIDAKPLESVDAAKWRGFKGTTIASDLVARGIDTVITRASTSIPADSSQPGSVRSVLN